MKLYASSGSSSTAVHIALRHLGVPFEIEKVDLRTKTTENGRDYREINYFGYVPALELDSGKVIFETPAILMYLFETYDPEGQGLSAEDRAMYLKWFSHVGTELHAGAGFAWAAKDSPEAKKIIFGKVAYRLPVMEGYLAEGGREYVSYDDPHRMGLLDIYIFGTLFGLGYGGFDVSPFPHIAAFMERMKNQPVVKETFAAEGF